MVSEMITGASITAAKSFPHAQYEYSTRYTEWKWRIPLYFVPSLCDRYAL